MAGAAIIDTFADIMMMNLRAFELAELE